MAGFTPGRPIFSNTLQAIRFFPRFPPTLGIVRNGGSVRMQPPESACPYIVISNEPPRCAVTMAPAYHMPACQQRTVRRKVEKVVSPQEAGNDKAAIPVPGLDTA